MAQQEQVTVTMPELKYAQDAGKCAKCGKPLLGGKPGDVGRVCAAHEGKMGGHYVRLTKAPSDKEYMPLSTLCRKGEGMGKSAYFTVKLTGKDGGTLPPTEPIFTVYVWEGRKYCKVGALARLAELAKPAK